VLPSFMKELHPQLFPVGGRAHSNGFLLYWSSAYTRCGQKRRYGAKKEDYPEDESPDYRALVIMLILIGAFAFLHWWIPAGMLWLLLWTGIPLYPRKRQWHWCEHQVAALLQDNIIPDHSFLRVQTPVTAACGSVQWTSFHLFIVSWLAAATHIAHREPWYAAGSLALAWSSVFAWTVLSKRAGLFHERIWISRGLEICELLGLPTILIGLGVQRLCTLKKPDAAQCDYAVRWGQDAATEIAQFKLKDASQYAAAKK
jgi:hypothetical protein